MTRTSVFSILLIMIPENLCVNWKVNYSTTHICALEGSSVRMSCSYTYPSYAIVTEASWINQNSYGTADLTKDKRYSHRLTVDCGDKKSQCSLHITKLTKADAQYQYYCRIITDYQLQKYTGKPGISLTVTGSEVMEGDHVTLTCSTTCNLPGSPALIWSKDGRPVEKKQNNQLQLHPVSYEDEGSYTCAVRGHENHPSLPMRIKVVCQAVVSSDIRDIKDGDNMTLTCNTTCHLPARPSFIWSKDGHPVEKKQIINNQLQLHPVSYEDEGNYTCAVGGHEHPSSPPKMIKVNKDIAVAVHSFVMPAAVGGAVTICGVMGLIGAIYWLRSCKGNKPTNHNKQDGNHDDSMEMDSLYQNQKFVSKGRLDSDIDTVIYENHGNIEMDSLYQNLNY